MADPDGRRLDRGDLDTSPVLSFTNSNSKTDNFKITLTEPPPPGETFSISGRKFYDANLNGIFEPGLGEVGIQGWKIELGDASGPLSNTTTDGPPTPGEYEFLNLDPGTYQVCEVIPSLAPTWIPTTETNLEATIGPDSTGNDFGNVCLGPGGGKTLGFWSNKNGEKVFGNISGLSILNPLYLRNGAGTKVTPLASYAAFRSWILSATATNMAYMLSAQLAAMELNVGAGYVSGGALVFAGACGNAGPNSAFISINDLMTDAASQIQLHGLTTSASDPVNRAIQGCLKNALDDANNNKNFVQDSPCDVNYSGLEPSCLQP